MYLIVCPEPGVLEVNYMWLPTWIGMNTKLLAELGEEAKKAALGKVTTVAVRDAHAAVIDALVAKFPEIQGLREYLEGLRGVSLNDAQK